MATLDQFERVLTALGVPAAEQSAWIDTVVRLRRAPGPRPASATAPYLGLAAYEVADADRFVGREEATRALTAAVLAGPRHPLVVLGASGSGKSSLLRAGLAAALIAEGTPVTVATASELLTAGPLPDLAAAQVLIVDQLDEVLIAEELTSPAADAALAAAGSVRELLARLATHQEHGAAVVLGLRADVVERALEHEDLAGWLAGGAVVVAPLTDEDLRRVIVEPARLSGVEVEDALVDVLVREATADPATGHSSMGPGVLPLVSHALYATWAATPGRRLTLARYREVGGLGGAIAQSAETVVSALTPQRLAAVRRVLLALVRVREPHISVRSIALRDLAGADRDEAAVLSALVDARLLTADHGHVRIAHEALLSAWPRLAGWIEEDRDALRLHDRLVEAAHAWHEAGGDADLLYRGAQLETMFAWESGGRTTTATEHAFLTESRAARDRATIARRRSVRQLRTLAAGLALLALTSATFAGAAVHQSRLTSRERDLAVSRQLAVTAQALTGTDPALSAQVAATALATAETTEARSAVLSSTGIPTSTRLGSTGVLVNAVAVSPDGSTAAMATDASAVVLWSLGDDPREVARLEVADTALYATAFTPDGTMLLAGGDAGLLHAWMLNGSDAPDPVPVVGASDGATLYDLTVSDDGSRVGTAASDGTVRLWSTAGRASPSPVITLTGMSGTAQTVAFEPGGRRLAAAGSAGMVTIWDVSDPGAPVAHAQALEGAAPVQALAWSPDGRSLAAGTTGGEVQVLDVATVAPGGEPSILTGPASWVNDLSWSPDGSTLAGASSDQHVWVWDGRTGAERWHAAAPTTLLTGQWSPDGALLYGSGADGMLREWSVPGPVLGGFASIPGQGAFGVDPEGDQVIATAATDGLRIWGTPDPGRAVLLGSSPAPGDARLDGAVDVSDQLHMVVAGDTAGAVHAWDISDSTAPVYLGSATAHTDWVDTVAFDASGTRLAVSSDDGSVTLWDLSDGELPGAPTGRVGDLGGAVYVVAFSPDATALVASVLTGSVRLVDVRDFAAPALIGDPLTGPEGYVYSTAFSPDGRTIAASGNDGTLWLWDVVDPARPRVLGDPLRWGEGYGTNTAFSPDGALVAEAMTDGTVRVWDLTSRANPTRWATLSGPGGAVYGIEFSPDGTLVSAASADRTVRLWDVTLDGALRRTCAVADRGTALTGSEWDRIAGGDIERPDTCSPRRAP
jgi:WD40 repeat protein